MLKEGKSEKEIKEAVIALYKEAGLLDRAKEKKPSPEVMEFKKKVEKEFTKHFKEKLLN